MGYFRGVATASTGGKVVPSWIKVTNRQRHAFERGQADLHDPRARTIQRRPWFHVAVLGGNDFIVTLLIVTTQPKLNKDNRARGRCGREDVPTQPFVPKVVHGQARADKNQPAEI